GRQEQGSSAAGGQLLRPFARLGALCLCRRGHGHPAQQHGSVGPHLRQPDGRSEEEVSSTTSPQKSGSLACAWKEPPDAGDDIWQKPPVNLLWSLRMGPTTSCRRWPSPSPTAASPVD